MTQKLTVSALVRICSEWRDFLRAADIIYEASRSPRPSIPSSRE